MIPNADERARQARLLSRGGWGLDYDEAYALLVLFDWDTDKLMFAWRFMRRKDRERREKTVPALTVPVDRRQ